MLLRNKTKEEFGYYPEDLSKGSHKKIWVRCDYCQSDITKVYKNWLKSNDIIDKDCCGKCKTKKGKDVLIKEFGVVNVFQLESVKEKSRETVREKFGVDYHTQSDNFKVKAKQTQIEKYGSDELRRKAIGDRNKANMQEKYGVDNPSQVPEFREKVKQTNLDKYGNEEYFKTEDYKEKAVSANLERYGVENVFASEEIKQKIRETNLEKYGVEYVQQNPEVREKVKATNLEKYGHEYACQNEGIKEKIRETNIERYGFPSACQCEDVKYKIVQTNLRKYGCKYTMQHKPFRQKSYETAINNGYVKIFDGKNMKQLSKELDINYSTLKNRIARYGFEVAKTMDKRVNMLEKDMEFILNDIGVEYKKHITINNRRTDFVIGKLIIEVDGLYWHSELMNQDTEYHFKKMNDYSSVGYSSLFFREDEIIDKKEIVKSIILDKLNMSTNIDGGTCVIKQISKIDGAKFFDENYLLGRGIGQCFGIFDRDELIACIRVFKNNNEEHEVSRYAVKNGYKIVGSFSKILKFIRQELDIATLNMSIDLRFQNSSFLVTNGFKHDFTCTTFRWVNLSKVKTFQRTRFLGNSGYDNNLVKIWDCGQAKYIKEYNVSK